ncbi:MAG TPA: SRPBCC family protein [Bryobacteraceae bacterium]|jgi:hypothetical protein
MTVYELQRETFIPRPLPEVFQFFSEARNLGTITPVFLHFRMLTPEPVAMHSGTELRYTLRVHGIPVRWKTRIETWDPPHGFTDFQERGPYSLWHHTHRFQEVEGGTRMEDVVRYALPLGVLGRAVHWLWVRRDVKSIFDYREERIKELFGGPGKTPDQQT